MAFIYLDWLYLLGMLVIWYGNISQIVKLFQTHSTKSFSFMWFFAMLFSFVLRLPRALTSTYWVWAASYLVSVAIMTTLVVTAIHCKRRYPDK